MIITNPNKKSHVKWETIPFSLVVSKLTKATIYIQRFTARSSNAILRMQVLVGGKNPSFIWRSDQNKIKESSSNDDRASVPVLDHLYKS